MKRYLIFILVITSFYCSYGKQNDNPAESDNPFPIPLEVGDWWKYSEALTDIFYMKFLIEGKITLIGKNAYVVGIYINKYPQRGELKLKEIAWQWDKSNNLFRGYIMKEDGIWSSFMK